MQILVNLVRSLLGEGTCRCFFGDAETIYGLPTKGVAQNSFQVFEGLADKKLMNAREHPSPATFRAYPAVCRGRGVL